MQTEIQKLREDIINYRDLYAKGQSPISDDEYDALEDELRRLSPNDALLKAIGEVQDLKDETRTSGIWPKYRHEVPMGSLDKVKSGPLLQAWVKKVRDIAQRPIHFYVDEKLDGISLCLNYNEGRLVSAVTRGDGIHGDNITQNAKYIRGVQLEVPDKENFSVSGEVVLPFLDFNSYWKNKGKANPRNTVAGVCKGRSPEEDLRTLQFVACHYYGDKRISIPGELDLHKGFLESRLGFQIPSLSRVVSSFEELFAFYEQYDKTLRDTLPYLTDGLVIKVNDLRLQDEKFTITDGIPNYAVAIKPSPTVVMTKVIGLRWDMGLSGRLCPVAQVRPTEFGGTTLRNVNMFNLDFLIEAYKKGFGIGATIVVERTGDVLPYYKRVEIPANKEIKEDLLELEVGESQLRPINDVNKLENTLDLFKELS